MACHFVVTLWVWTLIKRKKEIKVQPPGDQRSITTWFTICDLAVNAPLWGLRRVTLFLFFLITNKLLRPMVKDVLASSMLVRERRYAQRKSTRNCYHKVIFCLLDRTVKDKEKRIKRSKSNRKYNFVTVPCSQRLRVSGQCAPYKFLLSFPLVWLGHIETATRTDAEIFSFSFSPPMIGSHFVTVQSWWKKGATRKGKVQRHGPRNLLSLSFLYGQQALCLLMLASQQKRLKRKRDCGPSRCHFLFIRTMFL